jgi:hypothetical protein
MLNPSTKPVHAGSTLGAITYLSIRVFAIGRPRLAIDASGKTRAVRTQRRVSKPNLIGIAKDKGSMDMPMLLG